jgi:hypothetical protein
MMIVPKLVKRNPYILWNPHLNSAYSQQLVSISLLTRQHLNYNEHVSGDRMRHEDNWKEMEINNIPDFHIINELWESFEWITEYIILNMDQSQSQGHFTTGGLPPIISSWRQAPWDPRQLILFSNWTFLVIVLMQHPLWREDGSVVYNFCWSSPAQSFSGPSLRFGTPKTWRARSPYLYPPGTGRPGYTPRHWVPFSSPPTTRRAIAEVFDPPPHEIMNLNSNMDLSYSSLNMD